MGSLRGGACQPLIDLMYLTIYRQSDSYSSVPYIFGTKGSHACGFAESTFVRVIFSVGSSRVVELLKLSVFLVNSAKKLTIFKKMLEFYPNLNLNPAMLPDRNSLGGPDCNGRTG